MAKSIAELEDLLNSSAQSLPQVTSKKMFGCHALWADDNVFALVWKLGRIGFKLPLEGQYEALLKVSGAIPWKAGPMTMSHWVLVPESFHSKPSEIKKWAKKAHELCIQLEKKQKRSASKIARKKTATKKAK